MYEECITEKIFVVDGNRRTLLRLQINEKGTWSRCSGSNGLYGDLPGVYHETYLSKYREYIGSWPAPSSPQTSWFKEIQSVVTGI